MENRVLESINRTVVCSIVFVDIVEYSKRSTAKQLAMKGWFNDVVSLALRNFSPTDRVVLDTGDGAALCFLGDPEEALFAANSLRVSVLSSYPDLALRIGVNLGPVKIVKDINGQPNIVGDGINVAQRVMSFAEPNQVLVSRTYYEVVSRLADEYANVFLYQGMHQDKHVREHEVYELSVLTTALTNPPPGVERATEPLPERSDEARPEPLDRQVLTQLANNLSRYLGPLAHLLVRKTATRAADLPELSRMLAENLPAEEQRRAFLSAAGKLAGAVYRTPKTALDSDRNAEVAVPAGHPPADREISAQDLALAEQLLSRYIGPVAKVLVKKAARNSKSADEVFQRLAEDIDSEGERRAFLAGCHAKGR